MTTSIDEELRPVLEALSIESAAAFTFRDERIDVRPGYMPAIPGFPTHPLPDVPLVRELQGVLYGRCYSRNPRTNDSASAPASNDNGAFVAVLSQRNESRSRWEAGWVIYAVAPNSQVSLMKGDRQRSAMPGEFISNAPPGAPLQAGGVVTVVAPRESAVAQPGFYFAFGRTLSDVWDESMLLRFYFHATSEIAADLLGYLTRALNRYQVPFRLKTLNHPSLYGRADALVLYLARRYYDVVVRVVRQMPEPIRDALDPSVPLFTREIQRGVGLAEEPGTGESFGMHRCRLTAEGVVNAWTQGDQSTDGRLRAIARQFESAGFDLRRPHLNPGSVDFDVVAERVEYECA